MPVVRAPLKKAERTLDQTPERRRELKRAYIANTLTRPKLTKADMLTEQVKRVMQSVTHSIDKYFYELYVNSAREGHLPNGVPYAIIDDPNIFGTFVLGDRYKNIALNRPLILVNSKYSLREQLSIAMHEFNEWQNFRVGKLNFTDAHLNARKKDNLRIYLGAIPFEYYVAEAKSILYTLSFDELNFEFKKKDKVKYIFGTKFYFKYNPIGGYEVRLEDKQGIWHLIGYFAKSGFLSLKE